MKVALSRLDHYNKIKTLSAVFFLPFHLFRHIKTHKGNHTKICYTHCSYPNVVLLCPCHQ